MKRHFYIFLGMGCTAIFLAPLTGRADEGQISPERLDVLDQHGYFTPAFKAAVHDLVDTRKAVALAKDEQKKFTADLPGLQTKATAEAAKTNALRQELAQYEHPDETDFLALKNQLKDPAAKPEEVLVLAQTFVWAYPNSPHQAEALLDLQQLQKKQADKQQAEKDSEAARAAARQKLVERAQARDLSLTEWRDFLRNMTQADVLSCLGKPSTDNIDSWIYSGDWSVDPATKDKVGLQVNFNAGRVTSVGPVAHVAEKTILE